MPKKKTSTFHGVPGSALAIVGESDYKLNDGSPSCWIQVDDVAIYIRRSTIGDGRSFIYVEAFRADDVLGDELDSFRVETE
jgi:hypothetical protein